MNQYPPRVIGALSVLAIVASLISIVLQVATGGNLGSVVISAVVILAAVGILYSSVVRKQGQ